MLVYIKETTETQRMPDGLAKVLCAKVMKNTVFNSTQRETNWTPSRLKQTFCSAIKQNSVAAAIENVISQRKKSAKLRISDKNADLN